MYASGSGSGKHLRPVAGPACNIRDPLFCNQFHRKMIPGQVFILCSGSHMAREEPFTDDFHNVESPPPISAARIMLERIGWLALTQSRRLEQNQRCCSPKPRHSSRRDLKERRPRAKSNRTHHLWFCRNFQRQTRAREAIYGDSRIRRVFGFEKCGVFLREKPLECIGSALHQLENAIVTHEGSHRTSVSLSYTPISFAPQISRAPPSRMR